METPPVSTTTDQRRAPRRSLEAPLRMRIDCDELWGMSDNISGVGIMFFADEPLHVRIEVEERGELRTYRGRLVRVQKMSDTTTGYAIEFDAQ